ncbi:MAG: hypothetical protein AB7K35_10790 [Pseudorhodoplanes sp.]
MLDRRDAAEHCGRSLKRFEAECPVGPVRFPNGDLRYDVRDLDRWIDQVKSGAHDSESILRRLAGNGGHPR